MCTKPLQIGFWNAWSTFQLLNPLVNHFCQQSRRTSESLSCCLSRTILSTLTSERIQWCKCLMSVLEYCMNSNTASSRAAYSTVQQNFSGEHKHTDIPHEKPETGNGPSGLRLGGYISEHLTHYLCIKSLNCFDKESCWLNDEPTSLNFLKLGSPLNSIRRRVC